MLLLQDTVQVVLRLATSHAEPSVALQRIALANVHTFKVCDHLGLLVFCWLLCSLEVLILCCLQSELMALNAAKLKLVEVERMREGSLRFPVAEDFEESILRVHWFSIHGMLGLLQPVEHVARLSAHEIDIEVFLVGHFLVCEHHLSLALPVSLHPPHT